MRSKIFMYLFFFTILLVLFQYMNQKSIYEAQQSTIDGLTVKQQRAEAVIDSLQDELAEARYFDLMHNDNALSYLEGLGLEGVEVQRQVADAIIDQNTLEGGNPLVPYEGMEQPMRINKVKFLNHRWIQADFTDGNYWGEVLIEYFYGENMQLDLTPVASLIYNN